MTGTRRLTIVASGGLGDCLLASAFVRHFAQAGQYAGITCALPSYAAPLYHCSPRVTRLAACAGRDLWLWGLPEEHADVFVPYARVTPDETAGDGLCVEHPYPLNQGAESAVRQVAVIHGLDIQDESPEIFTSAADELWADQAVRPFAGQKRVWIAYRTPLPEKQYPLARWQQVVDALRTEAAVLELDEGCSQLTGTHLISPMPGLRQSAALVRRCDCVVAIDSFAIHLAAAVSTPAVALFGPTNPAVWGHPTTTCLRSSGCPVCANTPRLRQCRRRSCLEDIPANLVTEAVRRILSGAEA
jgi:ADP-heptose:LPS heptosyltransferase